MKHNGIRLGAGSPYLTLSGRKRVRVVTGTRSEKDEEKAGDELMDLYGFKSIHFSQARASHQTEGIPDRKYYHVGRKLTLWWEAKAADGEQSKVQREFQEMCEACGEVYLLGTVDVLAVWLATLVKGGRP